MLEIIGLIVWLLFSVAITAFPILFLIVTMSSWGGRLDKVEWLIVFCIALGAIFNWYKFFSLINITVG